MTPAPKVAEPKTQPNPAYAMVKSQNDGLEVLLGLEARFRQAKNIEELQFLAVNDIRKLTGARQVLLLRRGRTRDRMRTVAISSVAVVDRDTPLVRWIEDAVNRFASTTGLSEAGAFDLATYKDSADSETLAYPFRSVYWQPLQLPDGTVYAGLLQARERKWQDNDTVISKRLSETLSHAWAALTGVKRLQKRRSRYRPLLLGIAVALTALWAIPVPLSALAPMEVMPKKPFVIAAPIDGVIDTIGPEPNTFVKKGDILFEFDATNATNRFKLAEHEVRVAEATYRKTRQGAFVDEEARFNLSTAREEYELKKAERGYARELMSKTTAVAPVSGLLIYGDKSDFKGRPVSTGEAIMKIANPKKVSVDIFLPIAESIVLKDGAAVRIFLDADPLRPLDGLVRTGSYHAEPTPSGQLAFKIRADLVPTDQPPPRIGARGTAQVYGQDVSLGFYLFRRPISFLRQQFGI